MMWKFFVCLAFWGIGFVCAPLAAQEAINPASNDDEAGAGVGARPYEMDWANRTEPAHPQLVDFEDLSGWRVRCLDGADAKVYRSKQEMLFGAFTAKAVYTGTTAKSSFVIEPPEPIQIPGPFTAVDLWVRGNNWGWIDPPTTARVGIRVLVRDAKDEDYRIDLGVEDFDYWSLLHATCVSPDGKKQFFQAVKNVEPASLPAFPARFIGIEVSGCSNKAPARLYFDALSFYEMQYPPLKFDPAPEKLPWPTTPDTILPTFTDPEPCVLMMEPGDGTLSGLKVNIRGQLFQPCYKGSIVFDIGGKEVRPGDPGVTTTLVNESFVNDKEVYEYELQYGDTTVNYSYGIVTKNGSYIIDVSSSDGAATGFDIGLEKGLNDPKTVFVPYLTYGNDWPKVVCSNGKRGPVFLLALLDYYNSDASELFGAPRLSEKVGVDSDPRQKECIGYAGGAIYKLTTAGKRNPLHERLFVNVSGKFEDVLPNIPNPDSDTIQVAKEYLWRNIGANFQNEMLSKYKAYGIDKFIACHHEVGWREAGESFTMRDRPAPGIGDEAVQQYSAFVKGLGYRFGTYTNYVDYAPVNANWDENNVCLTPDGEWQKAWPRNYALKPLRAVEKEAYYAPRIHERYGTEAQYCDVHTAYTPWGRTDYDARTPGAGMFKTQFNAFARLLQNESIAHHGPVFSEGNYHWFYAGIVDGDYATIVPYGRGWEFPPIVDFDLRKMHTKMTDFGMGMPCMYYGAKGEWLKDKSRLSPWFDRFITATVAFGHIGFLTDDWGFDGTLKAYYMLHALQQRYVGVPVKSIQYFDGEKLVDTSTAIATDAYKRGQICTEYENGLTTWCNLSFKDDWKLMSGAGRCILKPASFFAYRQDDIVACCGEKMLLNVSRDLCVKDCDFLRCADYLYLDSRGKFQNCFPLIAANGSVAVKKDATGGVWIIPAIQCEEVSISKDWLGVKPGVAFSATGYDTTGEKTGATEVREGSENVTLMPSKDKSTAKYLLSWGNSQRTGVDLKVKIDMPEHAVRSFPITIAVPKERRTLLHSVQLKWESQEVPVVYGKGEPLKYIEDTQPKSTSPNTEESAAPPYDTGESNLDHLTIETRIPDNSPRYKRTWIEIIGSTAEGMPLWDFWAGVQVLPAMEIEFPTNPILTSPGKQFLLEPKVRLFEEKKMEPREAYQTRLNVEVSGLQTQLYGQKLQPYSLYMAVASKLAVTAPEYPMTAPVKLTAAQGTDSVDLTRYLRFSSVPCVTAELTKQPFQRGQCLRGGVESPYDPEGTAATVEVASDALAGETRDTLFTHPPYRKGVGYCFATFDVALPEGHPKLDFYLGFRAGCTTQDGCTFKVMAIEPQPGDKGLQPLVLENGKETEVFSDNYATVDQWAHRTADLSAFAGKSIQLKLVTDVGPNDNSYSDWALWGAPKVVMDEPAYKVEILPEKPKEESLPPPEPLDNLTRADLATIVSAKLTIDTAGVNGGPYTSYVYFNGVKIGATPESDSDTDFKPHEVALTKEAIVTIGPVNTVVIKNPGQDFMKVRAFCLHFDLADGRHGSSTVDLGPYTAGSGWKYEEGKSVPVGDDLPEVVLVVTVK